MRQVAKKGLLTVAAAGSVLAVTGGYAYADSGAQGVAAHSPGVASGNNVQVPVHVPVNVCGNTVNVVGALNPASGNTCVNGGHGGHGSHGHGHGSGHGQGHGHGGHHGGGSGAQGAAVGSPGVISGNNVQAPIDVPVNACGNTVDVVAVANPTFGNTCVNDGHGHGKGPDHTRPHHPGKPSHHHPPADKPHGDKPHGDHEDHGTHGDKDKPCDEHRPGGKHDKPAEHSVHDKPGHVTPGPVVPVAVVKDAHRPAQPAAAAVEERDDQLAHTGAGELGMAGAASAALLLGGAVLYRRARAGQQS
ncbi:chaplin [Streptomyces huiliensis]|uniref:chaplin n=1 Tax=Streptomyces huiliensis TaxID=2876027 RepID=UPI001CBAE77D|nr:chaplin [Streptomyces huiliensis]MBZ4324119.1 chaplin [Streptomyces huiliensis]